MLSSQSIGGKIAEARKKMGFSQAQLANQLFISSQAVGKWERGESMPDILTLNRLAEIVQVDLNYFSENFTSQNIESKIFEHINSEAENQAELSHEKQMISNFSGSNLANSDFAGVYAHKVKFEGSTLRASDFSGADLSGSSFRASDLRETNFTEANLSDCNFYALDLENVLFTKSILNRTEFNALSLVGAKFIDVNLNDVKLISCDLRKSIFENCSFNAVSFAKSDLRGLCLDNQVFIGVNFDNAALNNVSFKGATLKNVSFRSPYALTNKYYRALKTICFDGAFMDKLSYAALKGLGVDLSKVTLV